MTAEGHHDDLGRLVHDLRTPLAIVSGFAELLERRGGQLTPDQQAEYLTRIRESAARMGELLDEVG
jgi:two-component system OmpR family sensor kinase